MKRGCRGSCGSRAQISMEYLIVMGFVVLMSVPLVVIFFEQSAGAQDYVNADRASQIGRQVVDSAEKVYYLGSPSVTTLKVSMPDTVNAVIISPADITFRMDTGSGQSDVTIPSDVALSGNISSASGLQYIRIQSLGDSVNISS